MRKPFGFIKVGVSTGLIASQVHRVVGTVAIITLAAVIITTLVALALTNLILRPVLAVTSSMEQLAAGNAEVKLNVPGSDEFSNLADKFNVLSRRIRAERHRWESERGGIFDALRSIRDAVHADRRRRHSAVLPTAKRRACWDCPPAASARANRCDCCWARNIP